MVGSQALKWRTDAISIEKLRVQYAVGIEKYKCVYKYTVYTQMKQEKTVKPKKRLLVYFMASQMVAKSTYITIIEY